MVSLGILFWIFIGIFALIGAIRGSAKEILVTFSVIMAIFTINVLEQHVAAVQGFLSSNPITATVTMRSLVLTLLVFFGYQTPNIPRLAHSERFARDRMQDVILGLIVGGVNGYLIFGSYWHFLHVANYAFTIVIPPIAGTPAGDAALAMVPFLAPNWLVAPVIYYAVALAFIFVLVVFI